MQVNADTENATRFRAKQFRGADDEVAGIRGGRDAGRAQRERIRPGERQVVVEADGVEEGDEGVVSVGAFRTDAEEEVDLGRCAEGDHVRSRDAGQPQAGWDRRTARRLQQDCASLRRGLAPAWASSIARVR